MTNQQNLHLGLWLDGKLSNAPEIAPVRIVVTADASCNLQCEHCYWEHDIPNGPPKLDWLPAVERINQFHALAERNDATLQVVYAGRILSKRGARFMDSLFSDAKIKDPKKPDQSGIDLAMIDNGYTIFNRPEFLPWYQYVNISVDGWREGHDRQRRKEGSFDVAWGAILKLKEQGYDPISASALGPLTTPNWEKFEELLLNHDVRSSVTFVWDMAATKKRQVASIGSDKELISIFETLVAGVPKLINLYGLDHVRALMPYLKNLDWSADEYSGDGLMAECNGSRILYRPVSTGFFREIEVLWDGSFKTIESCGRASVDSLTEDHLKKVYDLAQEEREVWKDVSIKTQDAS